MSSNGSKTRNVVRFAALAALATAGQAVAAAAKDCPFRDSPFSIDSPLVDLLLNPAARQLTQDALGADFNKLPPMFTGTEAPTFAAILTVKEFGAFAGANLDGMPALDAKLRSLPVTATDKLARCKRYDNDRPKFTFPKDKRPRLLLFEKIIGFKDTPSVDAAHAALVAMAERKGWTIVTTDKAGAFNRATLKKFDAVIWNNLSGDVLTVSQRKAFVSYLSKGGGFVGIHGTAGDPVYFWDWYPDTLLGARFNGHPMNPQFQEARIAVNTSHPLAKGLPAEWKMTDEWYSFRTNPRSAGANILLTLDEGSYSPVGMSGQNLRMGDHPIAWTKCIAKGRMFYSAIGHLPATYSQPQNVTMLETAIEWTATDRKACAAQ